MISLQPLENIYLAAFVIMGSMVMEGIVSDISLRFRVFGYSCWPCVLLSSGMVDFVQTGWTMSTENYAGLHFMTMTASCRSVTPGCHQLCEEWGKS